MDLEPNSSTNPDALEEAIVNQEKEADDSYNRILGIPTQNSSTSFGAITPLCLPAEFHCFARQAPSIAHLLSSIASSETQESVHTDDAAAALIGLVRHPLHYQFLSCTLVHLQANSIVEP